MKQQTTPKTAYDILGIPKNAPQQDVHASLRRHASAFHPDRVPTHARETATNNFHALMDAYNKIRTPAARNAYDASLIRAKNDNNPAISLWLHTLKTVFWPFNTR